MELIGIQPHLCLLIVSQMLVVAIAASLEDCRASNFLPSSVGEVTNEIVNCSRRSLTDSDISVHDARFVSTEILDLSNNHLTEFPDLSSMTQLDILLVRNNSITDLCSAGDKLPHGTTHADLLWNGITRSCINGLQHVTTLKLEMLRLTDDTFVNTTETASLHLFTNVTEIPQKLFQYSSALSSLHLETSRCSQFPDTLLQTKHLTETLRNLTIIAPELSITSRSLLVALDALSTIHLYLGENSTISSDLLYETDDDLSQGSKQNRMNIINVAIHGVHLIPPDIFKYTSELMHLTITGFRENLPKNLLHDVEYLENLTLSDGSMSYIPIDFFTNTEYLKNLTISNNKISAITGGLKTLGELETLDLSHNVLRSISPDAFNTFKNSLRYLDLRHNPLCSISADLLHNMKHLEELYLDLTCDNGFDGIYISHLFNLKRLYINIADTSVLHQSHFEKIKHLQDVRINNIQIVTLHENQRSELISRSYHIPLRYDYVQFTPATMLNRSLVFVASDDNACRCENGEYVMIAQGTGGPDTYCIASSVVDLQLDITCSARKHDSLTESTTFASSISSQDSTTSVLIELTTYTTGRDQVYPYVPIPILQDNEVSTETSQSTTHTTSDKPSPATEEQPTHPVETPIPPPATVHPTKTFPTHTTSDKPSPATAELYPTPPVETPIPSPATVHRIRNILTTTDHLFGGTVTLAVRPKKITMPSDDITKKTDVIFTSTTIRNINHIDLGKTTPKLYGDTVALPKLKSTNVPTLNTPNIHPLHNLDEVDTDKNSPIPQQKHSTTKINQLSLRYDTTAAPTHTFNLSEMLTWTVPLGIMLLLVLVLLPVCWAFCKIRRARKYKKDWKRAFGTSDGSSYRCMGSPLSPPTPLISPTMAGMPPHVDRRHSSFGSEDAVHKILSSIDHTGGRPVRAATRMSFGSIMTPIPESIWSRRGSQPLNYSAVPETPDDNIDDLAPVRRPSFVSRRESRSSTTKLMLVELDDDTPDVRRGSNYSPHVDRLNSVFLEGPETSMRRQSRTSLTGADDERKMAEMHNSRRFSIPRPSIVD